MSESQNQSVSAHLVLSSGGVKCVSYAGAIAELNRNGVSFASVSACSGGSMVGALLCAGLSSDELVARILELNFRDLFGRINPLFPFKYPFSFYKESLVSEFYRKTLNADPTFKDLEIPFATVGIDIIEKRFLVYSKKTDPEMRVSEALKIAMAIPTMTPLYRPSGRIVVDAAVATESPIWLATDYDDDLPIIVLKPEKRVDTEDPGWIGTFIGRIINAGAESRDQQLINQIPGVSVIEIDCGGVEALDFKINNRQKEILIQSGKTAVGEAIKKYGTDFRENTTKIDEIPEPEDRDAKAANRAERMIRKFNNRLPKLLRDQIFISYSHRDADWLQRFQIALKPYIRNQLFKKWDDTHIPPGAKWQEEISRALDSTKVALLLVTQNFLASDYIENDELGYFIRAAEKRDVTIFWVAVGPSAFHVTPLKDYQCANDPQKPLLGMINNPAELDKTLVEICDKLSKAFN